jgi:hypothetical protein
VSAVIVGVGGVLGLGAKDVAVPFGALKLADTGQTADVKELAF